MKLVNIANVGRNVYKFIREDDYSLRIEEDNTFYPFFYELDERGKYNTYDGKKARIVFGNEPRDIAKMKSVKNSYSSDVPHVKNYLTYKVDKLEETKIKYFFIDIEVLAEEMPSADIADKPISCITVYNSHNKEYKTWWLKDYKDSWKSNNDSFLLKDFCAYIKEQSPDIIMGWHFVDFDYKYLYNRIKNFALLISPVNETRRGSEDNILFPVGISVVDYMEWFKKVSLREPSYALNEVCQRHLNDGDFGETEFGILNDRVKEKNQCFDAETEILTYRGWKKYNEILKTDLVLSLNTCTKIANYEKIENIVINDYEGEMLSYDSTTFNFKTTPNHNFLIRGYSKIEKKEISELYKNQGKGTLYKVPKTFKWIGKNDAFFNLDSIESFRIKNGKKYKIQYKTYATKKILMNDFLSFLGWYVGEGSCRNNCVCIAQSIKSKHYEEIDNLLKRMPFKYSRQRDRFLINSKQLCDFLLSECYNSEIKKCHTKKVPSFIGELSSDLITEFLLAYKKADAFITTSKQLADEVQVLCFKAGFSASVSSRKTETIKYVVDHWAKFTKPCYFVGCSFGRNYDYFTFYPENMVKEKYNGKVWCVETFPNHNVFVRRKGKCYWSGNSDVKRLVNLEEKFKIVKYFDDIRRLSFAQWEELTHNSYIIEMLLLKEAKEMGLVLPNKPSKDKNKDSTFQGAIREAEKTGRLFDIGKYDLTSAYPSAIINFNLDAMNLSDDGLDIGGIKIKQNPEALLPKVVGKLLVLKNNLKKELASKDFKSEEYNKLETKYNAIKGVINSAFGVIGYPGFRLFNEQIVSSITYLVRDLLNYARKRSNEDGNQVVYWDTDAVFVENKNNIVDRLNGYIKEWANKYNKDSVDISFEFEGIFEKIFILSKCRYIGYVQTKKGLKEEIKGLEIKRSSSSKNEASFQREMFRLLFEKDCTKDSIEAWIKEEKKRIKTLDLLEVGFPCKLNEYKEYVNEPIFVRAYKNRQLKDSDFKVNGGERFYWIYTKLKDKDSNGKEMNVIAFNAKFPLLDRSIVDYDEVIRRNITSKAENIYEAMKWETFSLHNDSMQTLF